ncbi:hypothetical protein BST97_00460 [Nonlabens spongiae]|uniref:Glycosyl hydrolase family 16 n=1 Tax=Nonlabens spongiae TaxID=331648 RepID=A0A1W6MG94_9FLAO|nr:carbohydrate-binding protein [Nonlabens spongiae]ARN76597.1 hypothetical protein BST97_00460 [Nonlabens spongiae]
MMKNYNIKYSWFAVIAILFAVAACERDISDDAVEALFPNTAEVYSDGPVGLTDEFFESFGPADGANPFGFNTSTTDVYEGSEALKISVPAPDDPDGGFIGGIFRDRGAGRNLTGYDVLTFWAKGSTTATVGEVGFGDDFEGSQYRVVRTGLRLSTNWRKYIIPIPDPELLVQERGLFVFAAGSESTGGFGYDLSIDEIKFENLGTIAQPRPSIFNGVDESRQGFIGSRFQITGLQQTWNTATNGDVTVSPAPAYFTFTSSNPGVVTVDENGFAEIIASSPIDGNGDPIPTIITASLNGVEASGSLSIISQGDFNAAPIPDRAPENVISIFSDAYNNVPVDYFNGFFEPFQTTQGGTPPLNINGDQVINYTDFNFVGVGTFLNVPSVDITGMTHFHVDLNVQESVDPGDFIRVELINDVGDNETSGTFTISSSDLVSNGWGSYDIPLSNFNGLGERDQLGLIIFVSDATVSNVLVDNIYYYQEVVDPTPIVDDSANTQVMLPIGFESTTLNYNITTFEGAQSNIITNPDQSGINTSSRVIETLKPAGSQFFAGTFIDLDAPVDFSNSQIMRMKVWSPKANIPIRLALETAGGGNQIAVDANVTVANEWTELEFDFSAVRNPGLNYQRVVFINEFIVNLPGDGSTYYADDIRVLD